VGRPTLGLTEAKLPWDIRLQRLNAGRTLSQAHDRASRRVEIIDAVSGCTRL
jgi:hypothetical protein